jgi:hypothetical protein
LHPIKNEESLVNNKAMKKEFIKPGMTMVCIQHTSMICVSEVKAAATNLEGEDNITYGGGGSGPGRSRQNSAWDDEEEDEF